MPEPDVRLVLTTCPDHASADALARALVEERLAACVTRLPGAHSTYRWQGQIEQADEVVLLIKTRGERLAALAERIRALHPYELPEVVALPVVGGLAPYLQWVVDETA